MQQTYLRVLNCSQAYRATLTNYNYPRTQNTSPDNNVASALEEVHIYSRAEATSEATAAEEEEEAGGSNALDPQQQQQQQKEKITIQQPLLPPLPLSITNKTIDTTINHRGVMLLHPSLSPLATHSPISSKWMTMTTRNITLAKKKFYLHQQQSTLHQPSN